VIQDLQQARSERHAIASVPEPAASDHPAPPGVCRPSRLP
jgi:hypothetical protein